MKSVRLRGYIVGVVVACVLSSLAFCVLKLIEMQRRNDARELAQSFSLKLVERVNESATGVYMLTASVDRRTGEIVRFEELAEELLGDFPLLKALELAPGGVIRHIYPLRGNEPAVGHDLLLDKTRNREVHLAISRRQTAVAGPLALRQGGLGVIVRYPLYRKGADGRSHFWGLSIGIVDYPSLLLSAGESDFARQGYSYELCWKPIGASHCKNIKGEPVEPPDEVERISVGLSQADWQLLVMRQEGWLMTVEKLLALVLVVIPSIAAGLWAGWRSRKVAPAEEAELSPPAA